MMNDRNNSNNNLLFGIRPILEAIRAGKEIDKLFIQQGLKGELFTELKTLIHQSNTPFQYVPVEKLNRLTGKNHQGVVAFLSEITYQTIEGILPDIFEKGAVPLVLILDRIT